MKKPCLSKHVMLYWEQDGYMGQSLPSMGERYSLKNLIRAADAFAGLGALSRSMSLALDPCHGPFIGSSWATATAADATRRAIRILASLFIDDTS
jgi:hypothetical protein